MPTDAFTAAIAAEIGRGRANGPYGAYPPGPLSVEGVPGPVHHA